MKTNYVCTVLLLLCVTVCYSCSEKINRQGEILSIDVRGLLESDAISKRFSADEIDSVGYIPLEITQDGRFLDCGNS